MRILIVAGGTGGHLFPAVRLGEEIKDRQLGDILFITTSRRQDRDILEEKNIAPKTLPVIGFQSKNILHILDFAVRLAASAVKSLFLILQFKPSVVIGFGGYVSGPVLFLSVLLRIKTIIHEQNVYPGRTNRILSGFVDKIAISFPETIGHLKRFQSKVIVSGNPLRRGLKKSLKKGDIFTVLAMGGSQGAHTLNKLIPEAVGLIGEDRKRALEVTHISGEKEKDVVIKAYRDKGIKNRVFSFTGEIDKLYNECDFVIARAGATTVSELLYLAKPSILVPYPYGDAHQRLNAKVLEDIGISILLEDKGLTARDLGNAIMRLMDRDVLQRMFDTAENYVCPDACNILMEEMFA